MAPQAGAARVLYRAGAASTPAVFLRGFSLRTKLDDIDLRIVRELQADGRMTNVELASRVGISPPPCLRRVRALEESGVITGYRGMVDESKLGIEVVCFAFVHLASQAEADLALFQERIRGWDAVRECWKLSGDIDFMMKCVAPDLKAFQDFVGNLTALPNVRNVRTALALDRVKDEPIVPFG
jgi:DNA-binding Lrp family transcriptional regulator